MPYISAYFQVVRYSIECYSFRCVIHILTNYYLCPFPAPTPGQWDGFCQYRGKAYRLKVILLIDSNGTISGRDFDDNVAGGGEGDLGITGKWDSAESIVTFNKNCMAGSDMCYQGMLASSTIIVGRWTKEELSDTFSLHFKNG